jgi:DivIVA domain-containing protein
MIRPRETLFERLAEAEAQRAGNDFARVSGGVSREEDNWAMNPDDIRSRRFRVRLVRGLDPEEVAAFLDEVAYTLERAQAENVEMGTQVSLLEDKVERLTARTESGPPVGASESAEAQATATASEDVTQGAIAAHRLGALRSAALHEIEALLHDAQARAQMVTDAAHERAAVIVREAEALKAQRQQEAEELVTQATATADSIVMSARDQEAAVRREIERLSETRLRLFDDVRATLDICHEWLATVDPRERNGGEREVLSGSVTNGVVVATPDDSPVG